MLSYKSHTLKGKTYPFISIRFANIKGISLVELLGVITIIFVLSGILLSSATIVKKNIDKAKTKIQFSDYALALECYREEYGHYPSFMEEKSVVNLNEFSELFIQALSGRDPKTGKPNYTYNPKGIVFYSFPESHFKSFQEKNKIIDAFGNSDIWIAVDTSGQGIVSKDLFPDSAGLSDDLNANIAVYSLHRTYSGKTETWVKSWE